MNVSRLSIPQRIVKGQEIITMSTGNEWVPANIALLAALADLQAANDVYEEQKQLLKALSAT